MWCLTLLIYAVLQGPEICDLKCKCTISVLHDDDDCMISHQTEAEEFKLFSPRTLKEHGSFCRHV